MKRRTKMFTLAMFSATGVTACAAILGINDRDKDPLAGEGGVDANGDADAGVTEDDDGPALDAPLADAELLADAACDASACAAAKGTCVEGLGCSIGCDAGCGTVNCPLDQDCRVTCKSPTDCADVTCQGGRSCTIDCLGTATCAKANCTSQTCRINCVAAQSCRDRANCAAPVCLVTCKGGKDVCENGVNVFATQYCGINCDGDDACEKVVLSCNNSPDASIACGNTADPCKAGPSCDGGYCNIGCANGCTKHCCNAATCVVNGGGPEQCP